MSKSRLFKWHHYVPAIILSCVRWHCRYALSYRDVEELTQERGLRLDQSTVYRWVQTYAPQTDSERISLSNAIEGEQLQRVLLETDNILAEHLPQESVLEQVIAY